MLKKVRFEYYRCFQDSTLNFKQLTIIVGKNNAGKSTVIEALRMIAIAGSRATVTNYIEPNSSLQLPFRTKGIRINTEKLKIDLKTIVYFYKDRNSRITASYSDNSKIVLHINKDEAFACLYDMNGNMITTKSQAYKKCDFGQISILPQIGLIKENEKILTKETTLSDRDTYLSSRHFRNELLLYKNDYFEEFCALAERTWPGLRLREISFKPFMDDFICFLVEDAGFSAELGIMGSGIQMWLQIIWFICRSRDCSTIILDEPDVYMHPDLQRKLIKFIKNKFQQVIIATHSTEILSEVEPRNIVTIDKTSKTMRYANSIKGVQIILDSIGSVQNISLIRLASSKKCLFVEGDDLKILSKFHSILYPDSDLTLETLPNASLGGWSRLDEAFGASKLFHDETEDSIKCYCILDRDYYSDEEIEKQKEKAQECFLNLHIWEKKEIENYILIPETLFRISKLKLNELSNFISSLQEMVEEFKLDTIDQISTRIYEHNRRQLALSTCNKKARRIVNSKWDTLTNRLSIISGKDMLSRINGWMKEKYKKSCSMNKILKSINPDEIEDEVKMVIDKLGRV